MPVPVTTLYAGLNAAIAFVLVLLVSRQRRRTRIFFGAGGNEALERAIRAHGNFVEYVPLALVVMLVLELDGTARPWLHAMGAALTLGRALHGWGLSRSAGASFGRSVGTALTWAALLGGLAGALVIGFAAP